MEYENMTYKELADYIKKITKDIRKNYKSKLAEKAKELKIECKKEIKDNTQDLKKLLKRKQSKDFYDKNYKVEGKITKRDIKAQEMFGKAFKELGECEKNKVLGALVTEHRREMRNEKRNRNRANLS